MQSFNSKIAMTSDVQKSWMAVSENFGLCPDFLLAAVTRLFPLSCQTVSEPRVFRAAFYCFQLAFVTRLTSPNLAASLPLTVQDFVQQRPLHILARHGTCFKSWMPSWAPNRNAQAPIEEPGPRKLIIFTSWRCFQAQPSNH